MAAGGGFIEVFNSDIETKGNSSAAIRSDKGGGSIFVDGGNYKANGYGSPAIYSTAEIIVKNAVLTATNSEAVVVEGKNSVALFNCNVSGNMVKNNVENLQNIMIYQSMSGDADMGRSSFVMEGGTLTSYSGDMIYVTNTSCDIKLTAVDLALSNNALLKVSGNDARNGWGRVGDNGGDCNFTATNQELKGDIIVDKISSLKLLLDNNTRFTGSINTQNQGGAIHLKLDNNSQWVLTSDSYVTSLECASENIIKNGYNLYIKK